MRFTPENLSPHIFAPGPFAQLAFGNFSSPEAFTPNTFYSRNPPLTDTIHTGNLQSFMPVMFGTPFTRTTFYTTPIAPEICHPFMPKAFGAINAKNLFQMHLGKTPFTNRQCFHQKPSRQLPFAPKFFTTETFATSFYFRPKDSELLRTYLHDKSFNTEASYTKQLYTSKT